VRTVVVVILNTDHWPIVALTKSIFFRLIFILLFVWFLLYTARRQSNRSGKHTESLGVLGPCNRHFKTRWEEWKWVWEGERERERKMSRQRFITDRSWQGRRCFPFSLSLSLSLSHFQFHFFSHLFSNRREGEPKCLLPSPLFLHFFLSFCVCLKLTFSPERAHEAPSLCSIIWYVFYDNTHNWSPLEHTWILFVWESEGGERERNATCVWCLSTRKVSNHLHVSKGSHP